MLFPWLAEHPGLAEVPSMFCVHSQTCVPCEQMNAATGEILTNCVLTVQLHAFDVHLYSVLPSQDKSLVQVGIILETVSAKHGAAMPAQRRTRFIS